MYVSPEVAEIIQKTVKMAQDARFEYVTPELTLYVICGNPVFAKAFRNCDGNVRKLDCQLKTWLEENMEQTEEEAAETTGEETSAHTPTFSYSMELMMSYALESAQNSEKSIVELSHLIHALYALPESYAVYFMQSQGVEHAALLQELTILYEEISSIRRHKSEKKKAESGENIPGTATPKTEENLLEEPEDWERDNLPDEEDEDTADSFRQQYAACLNHSLEGTNPLIGRQEELERTMQILCRREKNNPLHLGEPGVGKTAVTLGLARLLEENRVPEPLSGAKIFSLDLGSLLAGTQYRGDFERRFKKVMDSLCREEKPIVYIDEIHNIIGAGAVNGGSFDISNMLKPYLAAGHVRFIGATTYEEYKKHFEKSKSLVRRFQNIDIKEPDIPDTVRILEGLRETYENFHGITYDEGVLQYAAEMSAKYINERFLPDKAIDLIDEAGAFRRMHPCGQSPQTVDKNLIDEILSKTCHIPKQTMERDETETLASLESRLQSRVYGQNEALAQVVNAVKFSRAGLLEEGKPLASLLFVGPTGVGKTEIAKSLAEELGIRLIRFDMSEYGEKHAVAKLIGAPAGYVGYEEGGLLTEEIRRHPHGVLLLDEIEKAHPDIYNILLQVMDYATLTDNQGRKADFRNIILIMTSNAGASRMGKHGIGFQGQDTGAEIILEEVKRIFQPEFRNRLNRIVVFRNMDEKMAEQITDKKLGELQNMLARKNVTLTADVQARKLLRKKGISVEFGAREIERVIQSEIKPLLVDEMLFGSLKDGGDCRLTAAENAFRLLLTPESAENSPPSGAQS